MTQNWFDNIYIKAKGDSNQVPWANMTANAYLKDWLNQHSEIEKNAKALVIGCGLGDDAEILAEKGFNVTAFDISSTAIDWCKQRFPNSSVNYVVADLFDLDSSHNWIGNFDFVFEARTIQSLPLKVREQTMEAVAQFVAPEGTLLVVTVTRDTPEEPSGPPYPLSLEEVDYFQQLGLSEINRNSYSEKNSRFPKRLRIEYRFQSKS
ncbi:Thiopurine S-methyltransferase (TPMT) [Rivularia sp. PCC 7116]|uniref:class I SAM-dependent methyltransferase n=1 Tax=Rivularia sp. PCC 7116 TaxID=373994 RepID=UPI00029F04C5|nr:class I SAM-dependent methyltransferase [Rivularia sp. PCC 7116]AFY57621.1 Thiopurine S-methyltransferase (TPMT) [Rivularia sp. PCC 7116]